MLTLGGYDDGYSMLTARGFFNGCSMLTLKGYTYDVNVQDKQKYQNVIINEGGGGLNNAYSDIFHVLKLTISNSSKSLYG